MARGGSLISASLSRLYKKETGVSFVDCLNRVRVDAARACLLEGMNLKSAAARSGFRYYNYQPPRTCSYYTKETHAGKLGGPGSYN
jgi:AraC-like DNA-binding protein